ncbi:uncharacterized protein LOC133523419 [Cydia pomonella]|uniref:uncharacterized protein LOC133523419 n=1 Tax=Cydia pomonella TaxID=82600 RepID=UPI002ADD80B1|nr:uncharacterized protein LOC133523419 [Cydia pomonella]
MVINEEEYVTYERFYTLNKQCTSESGVMAASGSSLFYDLDSVAKRNSYSCFNEDVGLSTFNIFRALNRKGDEWPRAPSEPVHIVQECTTNIRPKLNTCDKNEENLKRVKSVFLRDCVLSSGICLKDSIEDTESSSNLIGPQNTHSIDSNTGVENYVSYQTGNVKHEGHKTNKKDHGPQNTYSIDSNTGVENYVSYQTGNVKHESHKTNKKDREKRLKDSCPCDIDDLGCTCKYNDTATEAKKSKSVAKQRTTSTYREEVITNMSTKNTTHFEMEDKLTRMSGDGLGEKYTVNLSKNDTSCILLLDAYDIAKMSHSQISNSRKSGVRLMKVVTNKVRVIPKKVRTVRCPNCHGHVELAVSTEDEASTGVQPKTDRKSETEFTCMAASKDRYHPKIEITKECPHGCEMVPLCQILPKVNFDASSIKQNIPKKTTPRFIKMTKACRHYPPCTVVPSCQRNNVIKANCESTSPCSHRPRCVNLPLCIPFCKNLQYDETTKHYVENEDKTENCYIPAFKCFPVSQYKLLQPHIRSQKPNSFEPRAYYVNQTHLSCQVPPLNTKQFDIATKSCQYDYPKHEPNDAAKEDAADASVIYIRDVGCQFKNSSFTPPHTSYFQTRVCYTSSASFDPGSKRLDNIYTNPKAFTCQTLTTDAKSKAKCRSSTSISPSSSRITPSQRDSSHKRTSKTHQGSNTVAFCMLRNGEGGYVVPVKPKGNALKGKCKNKFTIQRRQISKVLSNFWCKKPV